MIFMMILHFQKSLTIGLSETANFKHYRYSLNTSRTSYIHNFPLTTVLTAPGGKYFGFIIFRKLSKNT